MEDEWLLKAGTDRVKGSEMLLVRINWSLLCACALRIPPPITLVKKIDRVKYMKIHYLNDFNDLNVCGSQGS